MGFISFFSACKINNSGSIEITSVRFNETKKEIGVGESAYVSISYLPSDATDINYES